MKMHKILFFLFSLAFFSDGSEINAQVGLAGKRFLIKTDIINGIKRPISKVEAEYALSRKVSITASYSFQSTSVNTYFRPDNYVNWYRYASNNSWNEIVGPNIERIQMTPYGLDNFTTILKSYGNNNYDYYYYDINPNKKSNIKTPPLLVRNNSIDVSLKIYRGGAVSAPFGAYGQLGFSYGNVKLSGYLQVPIPIALAQDGPITNSQFSEYYISEIKKVKITDIVVDFTSLYAGGGKQFLLTRNLMLDISAGTSLNLIGLRGKSRDNTDNGYPASLIANKYGSNLLTYMPAIFNNSNTSFYNIGLYFNVKIGYLLF